MFARRWIIALTIGVSVLLTAPSGAPASQADSGAMGSQMLGVDMWWVPEPASVLVGLAGLGVILGRPKAQRQTD